MSGRDSIDYKMAQPGNHVEAAEPDALVEMTEPVSDAEVVQPGDHVNGTQGLERPADQTWRENGPPVSRARLGLLRHGPEYLEIREPLPTLPARVHMQLEGDTLGETDVPVEEHGERLASFVTVHGEGVPSDPGGNDTPGGGGATQSERGLRTQCITTICFIFDPFGPIWQDRRQCRARPAP